MCKNAPVSAIADYKKDPRLLELLHLILDEATKVHQVSRVKMEVAEAALDLNFHSAINTGLRWNPRAEYEIVPAKISDTCAETLKRLHRFFNLDSESLARSYVDAVILEAMDHQPSAGEDTIPTAFYGEVAITAHRNNPTMSFAQSAKGRRGLVGGAFSKMEAARAGTSIPSRPASMFAIRSLDDSSALDTAGTLSQSRCCDLNHCDTAKRLLPTSWSGSSLTSHCS
ncbi:hypothetical protein HDU87_001006 [Geranomyces variabilis]|uniref:Uncharacterized protein n=1 Tax=Geranomyces variabilis TaxID=109894 RepID=A0AAD5TBZ3_9FUNG|nr:hypothetical protein HDU87_001006 [Geranomyces variabilis]